ncbi:MAG: immunity 17 family protein [Bacteroidales bacterium]
MANIIAVILFVFLGIFALVASVLNVKWFFTCENGKFFIKLFGYKGARIFYGIVGVLILYMAYEIAKPLF